MLKEHLTYQTGTYRGNSSNIITIQNNGICNIYNGNFLNSSSDYCINVNSGTLNILGGNLENTSAYSVINVSKGDAYISNATITQSSEGFTKAITFAKGKLEINNNTIISSKNSILEALNGSEVILKSGVFYGILTVLGGKSSLKIEKNAKIISETSATTITAYNKVDIEGGEVEQKGSGKAIQISNGLCNIYDNAKISSNGEYTIYSAYINSVLNVENSTIINNASNGYAIYKYSGTINVKNANIIGNVQY